MYYRNSHDRVMFRRCRSEISKPALVLFAYLHPKLMHLNICCSLYVSPCSEEMMPENSLCQLGAVEAVATASWAVYWTFLVDLVHQLHTQYQLIRPNNS